MSTFVLVHGAWGGAHGFHLVRPLLQQAGHTVFTPSLTGIGERSHLTGPHITLTTHVRDVVNHVLYEDLNDVVLLGFSYGGMVVTGSLDHIGDRVRHLVYLDAFVPCDGQSLSDLTGRPNPGFGIAAPWSMPPASRDYEDEAEGMWCDLRRSDQPVGTFIEPVRLSRPLEEWPFSRTYVKALGDPRLAGRPNAFYDAGDRARTSPAWRYVETTSNHMIPHNRPAELASILLDLA